MHEVSRRDWGVITENSIRVTLLMWSPNSVRLSGTTVHPNLRLSRKMTLECRASLEMDCDYRKLGPRWPGFFEGLWLSFFPSVRYAGDGVGDRAGTHRN